jgi:hypothetical protein
MKKTLHLSWKKAGKVADKLLASIPPAYESKFSRFPLIRGDEDKPVISLIPPISLVLLQE